jgi:4a-hydroxytetrahydrobiopterin dehydratase
MKEREKRVERKKMTAAEAESRIGSTSGWRLDSDALVKRFEFADFGESLAFVNKVGEIAEAADHHPDITFGWGYAELRTTTHDRGGVTDVDFALVEKIDAIS